MSREEIREPARYYTIVGGQFRTQVSKDDPLAVRRDWTSADGKNSGTKYERIVNSLFGKIEDVSFVDGEYGMQLFIKLDPTVDDNIRPIVALNMASREAESVLKRLPNVDFSREVKLRPYDFKDDGEDVRGIEIKQPDEMGEFTVKVQNFFRDTEKKTNINDYPNPEGDIEEYSKDDWKLYFLQCRKFLVNYAKENICPQFRQLPQRTPASAEEEVRRGSAEADFQMPDFGEGEDEGSSDVKA